MRRPSFTTYPLLRLRWCPSDPLLHLRCLGCSPAKTGQPGSVCDWLTRGPDAAGQRRRRVTRLRELLGRPKGRQQAAGHRQAMGRDHRQTMGRPQAADAALAQCVRASQLVQASLVLQKPATHAGNHPNYAARINLIYKETWLQSN